MKKLSILLITIIILTSISCSVFGLTLGPTPTPTLTATPTKTPTPTQTLTPTVTPTPEAQRINFEDAGYQITIPGSYSPSDFSTQYDNGAVMMTGEDGDFTMVVANFATAQFAPGTLATILIMIFESEYGLEVDRKGLEFDITGLIDAELKGMPGEGWGFTGTYDGKEVEGELIGFQRDTQNTFLTLAFITTDGEGTWQNKGKAIFQSILETLNFTK